MPLYCECGRPGCPGDLTCLEKASPPLDAERVSELREWCAPIPPGAERKQRQPAHCWEMLTALCDHYLRATQRESGGESVSDETPGLWLLSGDLIEAFKRGYQTDGGKDPREVHQLASQCAAEILSASQRKECETCGGHKAVPASNSVGLERCPDCNGTGQRKETP